MAHRLWSQSANLYYRISERQGLKNSLRFKIPLTCMCADTHTLFCKILYSGGSLSLYMDNFLMVGDSSKGQWYMSCVLLLLQFMNGARGAHSHSEPQSKRLHKQLQFLSVYPHLTVWDLHMVIALLHGLMGTPNGYLWLDVLFRVAGLSALVI